MYHFSQIVESKLDLILEHWKNKVREDRKISASNHLSESALANSVPELLNALVAAISKSNEDDLTQIARVSLEHGTHRATQGYDAAEITREYSLLRQTVFLVLEQDLLELPRPKAYRIYRLIDTVIDEASAICFNQFVVERTKKLEQLQAQLQVTNEELQRLLSLNQETFSQLAHEIKTPINSIMGYTQLLLRQQQKNCQKTQEDNIEKLERVVRSSQQLIQLVNDALEVARSEAGKIELRLVKIKPNSFINTVIEIVEPIAQQKGLPLQIEAGSMPPEIVTDPSRLQQILINLLSNAIRYTDEGSVTISFSNLEDSRWSVIVKDTGIGIASEHQKQIFEPFSPAFVHQKRPGSTGLGLAIVAQLVKLLQGEIQVESEVGQGSTFKLTFPVKVRSTQYSQTLA